jgi:hypothetical protein
VLAPGSDARYQARLETHLDAIAFTLATDGLSPILRSQLEALQARLLRFFVYQGPGLDVPSFLLDIVGLGTTVQISESSPSPGSHRAVVDEVNLLTGEMTRIGLKICRAAHPC